MNIPYSRTAISRAVHSALWCAALSVPAMAQQADSAAGAKSSEVQSVVVSVTRTAKAIDKIAGAVSVVTEKELSQQMLVADDPSAALTQFVPGYAPPTQKSNQFGESMRGRAALILFDGIPQSNPLRVGTREGTFVDSAVIERVEVIAGASAVQGLGATGGIINYISKAPKKNGTEFQVDARLTSQFKSDSLSWKTGYSVAHKNDDFDGLAYVGYTSRGMSYDASGRRIGVDAQRGDTMDSKATDVFIKLGRTFGNQRIQFSHNQFALDPNDDYVVVNGNRAAGVPTTSVPGKPPGMPQTNDVKSTSLEWRHQDVLGGELTAQLYRQQFASMFGASVGRAAFQDPAFAPVGTLVEQSEITDNKLGARFTWVRPDLVVEGLELTAGLDWLRDESQQRLALTNRTWVPPMEYVSIAPFAQLEYDIGAATLKGGLRYEKATLDVAPYRTLWFNGAHDVQGGSQSFEKVIPNIGGIYRFGGGWSAYASYNEGFGIADVGVVLRSVNTAGKSAATLVDLKPVITKNKEIGLTQRGAWGNVGISYFISTSELGSSVTVNAATGVGTVQRIPVDVRGWELMGELRLAKAWTVNGTYSKTIGKRAAAQGAPLDLDQGARSQGPDKLVMGVNWAFAPEGSVRLQGTQLFSRHINVGRFIGASSQEEHFNGYALFDLSGSYKTRWGTFGVGIENLLDRQYIGYFAQADAGSQTANDNYFAGRGRTLTLSYQQKF
ncbi:TonB-dependent receptor [Janthinobacterium sp. 17J80-10]|uniref:TonB-dependent receptor n=1 Tax=Janthinobacterium sp. 17J80-10 TaxID=2497863 RepID=UPI0010057CEE|nr:TonB-dependent receptor [Janthinobacterium sp. 17J80-10]QAU35709.1 TonB-dependent receptor [Janthinobacterium sp. 17J80-10]